MIPEKTTPNIFRTLSERNRYIRPIRRMFSDKFKIDMEDESSAALLKDTGNMSQRSRISARKNLFKTIIETKDEKVLSADSKNIQNSNITGNISKTSPKSFQSIKLDNSSQTEDKQKLTLTPKSNSNIPQNILNQSKYFYIS